jgi:ABC-type transporter Mla maintaining outer membrane lipid asymmetry ATPase subunit MlaF
MPAELSGGMARRVALARALVMDPALLLCDELFTALDPISSGVVVRLLRRMNEALGVTIVVVSHDVSEVESLAELTYVLSEGEVVASGARPKSSALRPQLPFDSFSRASLADPYPSTTRRPTMKANS